MPRLALDRLARVTVPVIGSLTLATLPVAALVADSTVPRPSVCVARTLIALPTSAWTSVYAAPLAPVITAPSRSHWKPTVPRPSGSARSCVAASVSPCCGAAVPRAELVELVTVTDPVIGSLTFTTAAVAAETIRSGVPEASVWLAATVISPPTSASVRV